MVDQDYSDRPGYDPDFLESISVPLPALSTAMEKDTAVVASDAAQERQPVRARLLPLQRLHEQAPSHGLVLRRQYRWRSPPQHRQTPGRPLVPGSSHR